MAAGCSYSPKEHSQVTGESSEESISPNQLNEALAEPMEGLLDKTGGSGESFQEEPESSPRVFGVELTTRDITNEPNQKPVLVPITDLQIPSECPNNSVKKPDPEKVDSILTELTTSDSGIQAEDISSLLDLFLEYEQQSIDGTPDDPFLTPATSPGEVQNSDKQLDMSISSNEGLTPPDTPPPRKRRLFPARDTSEEQENRANNNTPSKRTSNHTQRSVSDALDKEKLEMKNWLTMEHDYAINTSRMPTSLSQNSSHQRSSDRKNVKSFTKKENSSQREFERRESPLKSGRGGYAERRKHQESQRHKKSESKSESSGNYHRKRRRSSCSDDEDIKEFRRMVYGDQNETNVDASDESDNESRFDPRKGERIDDFRHHERCDKSDQKNEEIIDRYEKLKKYSYGKDKQDRKGTDDAKKEDVEARRKMMFKFGYYRPKDVAKEERRVVYIGGFPDDTTRDTIRKRFRKFGPIENVKLHFREVGDNYGFLTFFESVDAVKAIEYGNEDCDDPHLDLCFGGRREYVGGSYVDFDSSTSRPDTLLDSSPPSSPAYKDDFDALLKASLADSKRRKNAQWT